MASTTHEFILFVIFGLAAYVIANKETPYHGSYEKNKGITYHGSHEKNLIFPNNIPYNVNNLYLDNNLIDTVDSLDLNFTFLVYLNLSRNVISKISPEAFINVKKLRVLDLSYNNIVGLELTPETFKKLESLELLILKGNPLGIIKREVFVPTYFSRVQYELDFSECSIDTIEMNSLVHLHKMTRLDLSQNHLSLLYPDTFLGLQNLRLLNLSQNGLLRIPTRLFHYLNVSVIDLSSNKISVLEDGCFSKNKYLQFLDLSNNKLASHPKDQFGDRFLKEIDLSQNPFETFDAQLLSENVRKFLRVLRITNSDSLRCIVAGKGKDGRPKGFENLEKLYLNDNQALTSIEPAAFSSSSKTLQLAYLNNTMLEEIPKDMFAWMNITKLYLSSVNLECNCHATWMLNKAQFDRSKAQLM